VSRIYLPNMQHIAEEREGEHVREMIRNQRSEAYFQKLEQKSHEKVEGYRN
jgi:hypothetical protein